MQLDRNNGRKKRKGIFLYSAWPLDRSKRFTLFALPDRLVHSDTNSASPGSILARQQLRAKTKSLTFPPLSIARCSVTQLGQLGRQLRERTFPIFETVAKGDSNPSSLDCEASILPLSYRAPQKWGHMMWKNMTHLRMASLFTQSYRAVRRRQNW